MKTVLFALVLALCSSTSAMAQTTIDVETLAAESGLSTRQIQMLFGAHAAYPEFKSAYVQVRHKFTAAVGRQRYEALLVVFKAQQEGRQVAASVARMAASGS